MLQLEGARAAEEVVQFARRVLERQLDVIETRLLQCLQMRARSADARGDQVRIKAEPARLRDQFFEIVAHSGSPPEKPSCAAPSARACAITRSHSSVVSSLPVAEVHRVVAERRNAAGSGRSVRRAATAAAERAVVLHAGSRGSAHAPAPASRAACALAMNAHTSASSPVGVERLLPDRRRSSAQCACRRSAENLAGALVELHHAFGIEQHVARPAPVPIAGGTAVRLRGCVRAKRHLGSLMSGNSAFRWRRASTTGCRA